jgi:iron complex outermembrane receptor protein
VSVALAVQLFGQLVGNGVASAAPRVPPAPSAPETVHVQGESTGRASRDDFAASAVLRGSALAAPGLGAQELLRGETGVASQDTGGYGSLSTASVRGSSAAQLPVFLAGVRVNDDLTGVADLSLVPLWLLSRVEIYRGNAPLEADPWGIGGAVFFEPRRPRGTEAALGLEAGSFGYRGVHVRAGAGGGKAAALFGVRATEAHNRYPFVDDRGTRFDASDDREVVRENADVSGLDAWALATVEFERATTHLLAHEFSREQGVAGLGTAALRAARVRTRRSLYGARISWDASPDVQVQQSVSAMRSQSTFDDPLFEMALGAPRLDVEASRAEGTALVRWRAFSHGQLAAHVRAAREALSLLSGPRTGRDAGGSEAGDSDRLTTRVALAWTHLFASRVKTLATVAVEPQRTQQVGAAREGDTRIAPAARVSASARLGPLELVTNLGTYFRQVTLGELYGFSGAVRGNPALVPERSFGGEVGVVWPDAVRVRHLRIGGSAYAYARAVQDLVAYRRTSFGFVSPYNVGRGRMLGVEAEWRVEVAEQWTTRVGLTLLDPRDASDARAAGNDLLPFQSRLYATITSRWAVPGVRALGLDQLDVGVQYQHQASRFADPAGLVVIPAQGNLSADVSALLCQRHLQVQVRATNLLGQDRFDTIGYPLPGRAVYAASEVRF